MNRKFVLSSPSYPRAWLRTVLPFDSDKLRIWKNEHRHFFFYQDLISPEDQERWFEGYLAREHDYMFMVITQGQDIGCMGFRLLGDTCDIYNVISGLPQMRGSGFMRQGFHIMCSYALSHYRTRISAKVIHGNPAIGWYSRNGYRKVAEYKDYLEMEIDQAAYWPCLVMERSDS
jgi:ribosomal protein S18 acetylase RimI-like enzyme